MDTLGFAGVGLFTNHDGVYLGDPNLDPIFDLLSARNLTAFVHPTVPNCWKDVSLGNAPPLIEFPFDTMRAIMNLFLTGTRARYQYINMILSHGGGVLPFLAERVAYSVEKPAFGGYRPEDVLDQFKGYFFDTASTVSRPQLAALDEFGVAGRLMTGTDCRPLPFFLSTPLFCSMAD
jgi:predicted TIM-barrel fold metal-dependent hydrolase